MQQFDNTNNTFCADVRGKTYFGEIMDEANFEEPTSTTDNPKYFKYNLGGSYNVYITEVILYSN